MSAPAADLGSNPQIHVCTKHALIDHRLGEIDERTKATAKCLSGVKTDLVSLRSRVTTVGSVLAFVIPIVMILINMAMR
jgi:hypothetical protein